MQYDYFAAYLDFFSDEAGSRPAAIAAKYADHPVDRWRNPFAAITAQLDEIEGKAAKVVDAEDRDQQQTQLAATEPSFDFKVEAKQVDAQLPEPERGAGELLPDGRRAAVQPQSVRAAVFAASSRTSGRTQTQVVELPQGARRARASRCPQELPNSNVLVEIIGGGHDEVAGLLLQRAGRAGDRELRPGAGDRTASTGKPLPKVYVKVYAQLQDGRCSSTRTATPTCAAGSTTPR